MRGGWVEALLVPEEGAIPTIPLFCGRSGIARQKMPGGTMRKP